MKKYLVLIGAAALVMGLASPSMAQYTGTTAFKSYGHVEVETVWAQSMITFNKDAGDNRRQIAERFRYYLEYGDVKTVRAIIGIEANSQQFGEPGAPMSNSGGVYGIANPGTTGQPSLANRNKMGAYQTDQASLLVHRAYLEFTIPTTPISMRTGLFNEMVGGYLGRYWLFNDVPGIELTANFAPHSIKLFYIKENKQNIFTDNDNDMYGAAYNLKQKNFNIEAFFGYRNDLRTQTETWGFTALDPATGAPVTPTGQTVYWAPTQTITPRTYAVKPWWLGANVPIMFGNWKIEPTLIYMGGQARDPYAGAPATITKQDFDAYLGDLQVSYRLGPGLAFLVEGFYTSGTDRNKTDKANQYQWPTNSEGRNVFGNGWSVFYYCNTELTYYGFKQLDPGGTAYARANAEFNPLAWLNLNVNYLYIWSTNKDTNGTIVGARTDQTKADIGQEINLIAKLKIYQNFIYAMGFGYFIPGSIYENSPLNPTPGKSADQAWNILTNLKYVF